MNKNEPDKTISPIAEYAKILRGLELKNILLTRCVCNLIRERLTPDMKIAIRSASSYKKTEKDIIEIAQKYFLEASSQTKKEIFLNIECDYILEYASAQEINDAFFERFKKTSLPLNAWPFFREFVNNITSRMYIPPFTLPLIKNI